MKRVGLMVNRVKWETLSFAPEVIAWLTERDVEAWLDNDSATMLGREDIGYDPEALTGVDLLITLGGDGTILRAAQIAAPHGIPILGVHMGSFGFMAETKPDELYVRLDEILEGRMTVEERMMVRGEVVRGGEIVHSVVGLNEIALNKGAMARMLHFTIAFGGEPMVTYPADGVVAATPTGSTGYALSAGGPLIEPTVQALLVAPICPHTLAARPLVIPAEETVSFTMESEEGEIALFADSGSAFLLHCNDRVDVRRAEHNARIVTFHPASFYRKIRRRLLWGGRD